MTFSQWRLVATVVRWAAALVALSSSVRGASCGGTITAPTGETYNIESIVGQIAWSGAGVPNYKISICSNSVPECGLCPNAGYCEFDAVFSNCFGTFGFAEGLPNGVGVQLTYAGGEFGHTGIVQLVCDPSALPIGDVVITNRGASAVIKSSASCPNGGGGRISPGGIILLSLLLLAVVYFVGGVIFLKLRSGAQGAELIPNADFWVALPGLVADGGVFAWQSIRGRCSGSVTV